LQSFFGARTVSTVLGDFESSGLTVEVKVSGFGHTATHAEEGKWHHKTFVMARRSYFKVLNRVQLILIVRVMLVNITALHVTLLLMIF